MDRRNERTVGGSGNPGDAARRSIGGTCPACPRRRRPAHPVSGPSNRTPGGSGGGTRPRPVAAVRPGSFHQPECGAHGHAAHTEKRRSARRRQSRRDRTGDSGRVEKIRGAEHHLATGRFRQRGLDRRIVGRAARRQPGAHRQGAGRPRVPGRCPAFARCHGRLSRMLSPGEAGSRFAGIVVATRSRWGEGLYRNQCEHRRKPV